MEDTKIITLADVEEIEKTPIEQRLTAFNTYDMIKQGAAVDPDAVALSFFMSGDSYDSPMRIPYKDLIAQITRTANLFHDMGIGSTDVVSYLLPNAPHTHYVLWGGEAAGIVNPINPLLEPSTMTDICRAAGTKVLVALGEIPGSDIWQKALEIRKNLPDLKAIIRVFGPSDEKDGIYGFDEVIGKYNGDALDSNREIDGKDTASMYHTGGTTGTPKLAPHTHFNEVAMALMMKLTGFAQGEDNILCGLPLFHVNGTTVTGLFPFSIGAHVVLLSPQGYRDPAVMQNFYKIVEFYKANFFSCVPTVLSVLLDIHKGDADISSLRFALCGAAPLSVELFQRFEAHTDMKILEGYGLTEGTTASSVNPAHGERKIGSIGLRLPYNDMKVFVQEADGPREAKTDEIGAVCIKGVNVFKGYLDESKNKDIWVKEGWLNTGDLGRQDTDGFFWLTGRQKDLIIRGGHNIDPAMIEEPLYRLEGVQVAAAVARPDPHAGEVPVAFVQFQQGFNMSSEEIIEYLQKEVGERAAVPKEVFVYEDIPLTPIGKIFKPALRWEATKRVYEKELKVLGDKVESVDVEVGEDKLHGTLAKITVRAVADAPTEEIEAKAKEVLARYTVKFDLKIV